MINITTRDGGSAPVQGLASGAVGSYGFYKTLAEGGGTLGSANYRVSMSHAAADGYRQHTAFWSDNIYSKLHWMPNPRVDLQQILAWTDHFEQNAEGLSRLQAQQDPRQPNSDAIPKNEFYKISRFTAGLTGRFGIAPGQALNLTGFFRTWKYMEPRPPEIIRRQFLTPGLTLQYDFDPRGRSRAEPPERGGDRSGSRWTSFALRTTWSARSSGRCSPTRTRAAGAGRLRPRPDRLRAGLDADGVRAL